MVISRLAKLGSACLGLAGIIVGAGCSRSEPPACPVPGLVSGLESANFGENTITDDPQRIVFRGRILGFTGGCDYRGDGVFVRLNVDLTAVPGPAYDRRPMTFPYFVAVLDPSGNPIDKQVFQVTMPLPVSREAVGARDTIEQRIAGVTETTGPNWRIVIGIDMPPEAALRREEQPARPAF
jgi:hypothetical protein